MNKLDDIQLFARQPVLKQDTLLELSENPADTSASHQQHSELSKLKLLPKLHEPRPLNNREITINIELSEKLGNWVRVFSSTMDLEPSVVFLAIYKILLYKYANLDDVTVGVISDIHPKGAFSVCSHFEDQIKFNDFLHYINGYITNSAKDANDESSEKTSFQITYIYRRNRQKKALAKNYFQIDENDIELEVIDNQSAFNLNFRCNTDVYSIHTIQRFSESYTLLLSEVNKNPACFVQSYPIITPTEKQQLLVDFNQTQFDYPKDSCIHHLFAEKVMANPDKTAVLFEDKKLSYQQLYNRCYDLALFLQSLGVLPDSIIGLCLERSIEMMIGIQGIFMAGGAYVPMDPDYPDSRLTYMLEDGRPSIVLCQAKLKGRLSLLVSKETMLIALDENWNEIVSHVEALKKHKISLRQEVQAHHLAYVIYTSGSTGVPKGVMVEHRALMNRIDWMQRMYSLGEEDVVLQKTPFSFDVSVWEFVWPIMAGASLVFAKPGGHKEVFYLENLIKQYKVTTLHFVPSMLQAYIAYAQDHCDSVRQLFCSGEALDSKSVFECKNRFPKAHLHNLYGPTEAAIDVTSFDCSSLNTSFVPIGTPISNTQIYIVDQYYNPQPIGVPGELHIAGDGLARGYLNREELTNERFVVNPFHPETRLYKTGDWARWMEDGNIEFLGRMDTQVKIRGFRIEIGEIETQLNQHPGIINSHIAVQGVDSEKKLVAFYQAKETKPGDVVKLPSENLRSHLSQSLPAYMLPTVFVSLETFPTTSNGKLNRRALENMDIQLELNDTYLAPSNETEHQLVQIWAEILNIQPEKISTKDSFFELGGHSLLIAQLITKIRNQLAIDLPLNIFFDQYTITGIAEVIKAANSSGKDQLGNVESDEITI